MTRPCVFGNPVRDGNWGWTVHLGNLPPPPQCKHKSSYYHGVLYLVVVGSVPKILVGEILKRKFLKKYFLKIFQFFHFFEAPPSRHHFFKTYKIRKYLAVVRLGYRKIRKNSHVPPCNIVWDAVHYRYFWDAFKRAN